MLQSRILRTEATILLLTSIILIAKLQFIIIENNTRKGVIFDYFALYVCIISNISPEHAQ